MRKEARGAHAVCVALIVILGTVLGAGPSQAGPEEQLERDRRQLLETRTQLAAALGPERLGEVQAAQAEVRELKPWLAFFRDAQFSTGLSGSEPQALAALENAVRHAEAVLEGWRRDDAEKGQGEGPQALQAAADLETARANLARFKEWFVDDEVARVATFTAQGITTFDELERRYRESNELLEQVKRESSQVGNLVRKIENLERSVATLEVRAKGQATYRLAYVLRRPRGTWERSVPDDVVPNGGSWTRAEANVGAFTVNQHEVNHEAYEDWAFRYTVSGLGSTITVSAADDGQMFLELDVTGQCTVNSNVPEDRLSGGGALLDARAGGAFSRFGQGGVGVGLNNRSAKGTFRFRVSPGFREGILHVFLWNIPVGITCVYIRE